MRLPRKFKTKRTVVRIFNNDDLKGYWNLIKTNRERLEKDFPITLKNTRTKKATESWIDQKIKSWSKHTSFSFVILENENDTLIGQLTIKTIDWKIPKAEMAYFIDKDWEGKGITTEVVKGGIDFCFNNLKLNKVFIRTAPDNRASQRIAEKCGFKKEGLLKKDHRQSDGTLSDVLYYGLLPGKKNQAPT